MFLGAMASTEEVSKPIWFEKLERLTSTRYIEILKTTLLPWMARVANKHRVLTEDGSRTIKAPFVWQQDGAPAHTAKATQNFLEKKLGKSGFWDKKMRPPNSPDLNPLYFSVWNAVSSKACGVPNDNIDTLKASVEEAWINLNWTYIVDTCKKIPSRLQIAIDAQGSVIE